LIIQFYKSLYKFNQISLREKLYFKFQTKSHEGAKKEKKEEVITEPVKIRDLKISDPGWDSFATFPS